MPIESPNGAAPAPTPTTGVVEWTLNEAIRQQEREVAQHATDLDRHTREARQHAAAADVASRGITNASAALAELRAARAKLIQEA